MSAPAEALDVQLVPLLLIDPPVDDVRIDRDKGQMADLTRDIAKRGVQLPILIARVGERFEIVDGYTRWLCAREAGLEEIPARIYPAKTPELEFTKFALNVQRLEMSPCDEAVALGKLFVHACGEDIEELARRVNKSVAYCSSRLELLNGAMDVFETLRRKDIGIGVAKQLNKISDANYRAHYLGHAVRSGATEAVVANWVSEWRVLFGDKPAAAAPVAPVVPGLADAPQNPFTCEVCNRDDNVHLIRQINVHQHCKLAILDPLLRNARGEA